MYIDAESKIWFIARSLNVYCVIVVAVMPLDAKKGVSVIKVAKLQ